MSYQDYNVLIIDDDKKFAESLKEAVTRAGFRAYVVHTPEEALSYTKIQDVHILLVDCMLPRMNGLELVKKIQEVATSDPMLYIMSGIYKDKQFINSALKKTGAKEFLTKPFDLGNLLKTLEGNFSKTDEPDDDFNPMVRMYLKRESKIRKIIKTINSSEGLHNFDLPWVFKLLIDCEATGHLNIACTNGDIAGVGFDHGTIVQVNIKNEASLLGLLLVEQGYLDRQDLNEALESNTNKKMIGRFLVESNMVSPHAIEIVLKEQLIWRLKRLIADSQMELNFVKSEDIATIAKIESKDFTQYILDTIENTIRIDWLKAHYLPLSSNLISINSTNENELQKAKMYPYVARTLPSFESLLKRGTSLEEILARNPSIDGHVLKVIHFMNIMGFLQIKNSSKTLNFNHQAKRLQKLQVELDEKNYFERLGVSRSAKESDIRKAYFDLAKVLHPDKLSNTTPAQVKELSEKVFGKIQVAYDTLKKTERKDSYLHDLDIGQSEKILKGDEIFDVARQFLLKGQFSQAKHNLQKALKLNPDSPEFKMHNIWCDLKVTKNYSDAFIGEVDKRLNQIPLESRDTAAYYHTRGLYYLAISDNERAKKYFSTALNIDPSFISSRRELSSIKPKKEGTSILQVDLKDVIGGFFKK